ncbi:MAG: hypothetical protein R3Y38_07565 [Rikenellaceae bacterium]
MELLLGVLIGVFLIIFVCYSIRFLCVNSNFKWIKRRRELAISRLLKSFYQWIYQGYIPRGEFSHMLHHRSRSLAIKILAQLREVTHGHIPMRLERFVAWRKLDKYLLRLANRRRGLKRALIVKTLFLLPLPRWSEKKVIRFEDDKNAYVRLFALMSHLDYDFSRSIDILHEFKGEYRTLDYCMLAKYFHRRSLTKDFHLRLLRHEDERLQFFALYIIRMRNLSSSGGDILKYLPTENDDLVFEMLKTLVVVHYDMNHERVVALMREQKSEKRKYLYRLAASEGYSLGALERVLMVEKHAFMVDYVVSLIQGGKYKLV